MIIRSAEFQCSSQKVSQCPANTIREFAFIGRSNVGKSSLINMLTNRSSLAKVSGTPGKTRLVNHFIINEQWYLVDLPGYGYAKASKSIREGFSDLITEYILERENLFCLYVLIDSRLEPQKIDQEFLAFLGENGIPFSLIFTKSDKLSKTQLENAINRYKKIMLQEWEEFPNYFVSSSETKVGQQEILDHIEQLLNE